ncbi:hypothetical protein [Pseudogulbenkiania sp. MAI-1]|uniref:hypothetical protein n=1 Tax=Pseudogulbenkiania sp. MAI-1 TaxID=990370 RepID=UPI00045EC51E|nr:hypothetical protein [Pseudogulbenkiania sp. MAI-1]
MSYFLNKLLMHGRMTFTLPRYRLATGIYGTIPAQWNSIGLDLADPAYIHLGDQLFYEPMVRALLASGKDVCFAPIPAMRGYFGGLGYPLSEPEEARACDVVITPVWALPQHPAETRYRNRLYVHAADSRIDAPIAQYLAQTLTSLLGLPIPTDDFEPHYWPNPSSPIMLDDDCSYVLFNNYVDSSRLRIGQAEQQALLDELAKLKAQHNVCVLHVGSNRDKAGDLRDYGSLVDRDLRGQTTIETLFHLALHPSVRAVVSFDNFIMHLGLLARKACHIRLRRHQPVMRRYLECFVNPPFPSEEARALLHYL